MSKLRRIKKTFGNRYLFNEFMDGKEICRLKERPPAYFSELTAYSLTAGSVKIEAVIYSVKGNIQLGYDILVKYCPEASEWICYDNLPAQTFPKGRAAEAGIFRVLDEFVENNGLSYTECQFERLQGKTVGSGK
jgi:hypothetical protein